jgi:hypothetical protein
MQQRRSLPVRITSIVLGLGLITSLAACSGGEDPTPTRSPSHSRTATSDPTASPTQTPKASPAPSSGTSAPPAAGSPSDDQTGSADDGNVPGTGNGSGVEQPSSVDFSAVTAQGVAAAGGGTAVSIVGSGDDWTVVVSGPDGSQTQSVVSATLGRVTSGPFPKDADAATKAANVARSGALRVQAGTAATRAVGAVPGSSLSSLVLGGSGSAPVWTATVAAGGSTRTVTVDGLTGTATAS